MALVGLHDVSIFPFSPYPGSELFMQLEREGVIHLDDDHIHSLAQFGNMFSITSYSEHISNRMLRALMLFGIFLFYLASFSARPIRLAHMVYRLARHKPMSKLENTLSRLIRKRRIRTA
jgi:hypothetical protein